MMLDVEDLKVFTFVGVLVFLFVVMMMMTAQSVIVYLIGILVFLVVFQIAFTGGRAYWILKLQESDETKFSQTIEMFAMAGGRPFTCHRQQQQRSPLKDQDSNAEALGPDDGIEAERTNCDHGKDRVRIEEVTSVENPKTVTTHHVCHEAGGGHVLELVTSGSSGGKRD